MTRSAEHQHQVAVVQWFDLAHPRLSGRLVASANGAHLAGSYRQAARLKAAGMAVGFPDLFLPVARGSWHGLAIEMKRPATTLDRAGIVSREQADWLEFLRNQGYCALACFGVDEAIDVISRYLTKSGIIRDEFLRTADARNSLDGDAASALGDDLDGPGGRRDDRVSGARRDAWNTPTRHRPGNRRGA